MARENIGSPSVEVEVDGPRNESLYFGPIQRSVRGRFDLMRVGEPMAKVRAVEWPSPIPSQRLGVDEDGCGYIREPLHDLEHAALKSKIEKQGMTLAPAVVKFAEIDLATWYFWLKAAVAAGIATVVDGELPARIGGKPRMNFVLNEPQQSSSDKLTQAINRQSELMEQLLTKLAAK